MEVQRVEHQRYCLGCLCSSHDHKISEYRIQYAHFWAIFEGSTLELCYVCRRVAQRAEQFIQNVHTNQILLQNYTKEQSLLLQEAHSQLLSTISLTQCSLDPINIQDKTESKTKKDKTDTKLKSKDKIDSSIDIIEPILICDNSKAKENDLCADSISNIEVSDLTDAIKTEMKEEEGFDHLEAHFVDENDDLQDPYIKEENDDEDEYPLNLLKAASTKVEAIDIAGLEETLSNSKKHKVQKKMLKVKKVSRKETKFLCNEVLGIKKIYLKEEEAAEERRQQALDPVYLNCSYKCEDCLKGFNFKAAYDKHMKRHSEEAGEYFCNICKIRMDKRDTWLSHYKSHNVRWKCLLCGLVRTCRSTMVDHHNAVHKQGESHFACPYCPKTFKRQMSQRKHIRYTHVNKERVTCTYCKKSYANKEVIKAHMMSMHPKEVSAFEQVKKYPCEECGMMFRSPTHLKMHGYKHSKKRDYYCVECDKGFKSEAALKQHLKTTQIHVSYSELPLSCDLCKKRFAIKRDLDRHMNSIHLEVKPFKCDKCDKAYVSNWSLRDHTRTAHEGYKRPLRYPCKFCDKIFDRNSILKAHIRTHTGERPYQCDKCPAQFSQSGVLATHNKLIHQRLTRDGKPKQNIGK